MGGKRRRIGRRTATIRSPGASTLSRSGASPGRRWNAVSGMSRRPAAPSTSTTASNAANGTQKSDGLVAMQLSLQPRMACSRFSPAACVAAGTRARVCCRRRRCRRNRRSGCVAAGCRRPWRRCEAGRRRRTAGLRRWPDMRFGEIGVVSEVGVADAGRRCACRRWTACSIAVEAGDAGDVDEAAGAGDAALHQVDQVGTGGEVGGTGR